MPVPKPVLVLRRIYCWISQAWVRCHPWSGGLAKPLDLRVRNKCFLKVRECWADKNSIVFFIYCLFYNSESWMKRNSAAMTQVSIQVDRYLLRLWPVDRIEKSNCVFCSTLTRFRSSFFLRLVPADCVRNRYIFTGVQIVLSPDRDHVWTLNRIRVW